VEKARSLSRQIIANIYKLVRPSRAIEYHKCLRGRNGSEEKGREGRREGRGKGVLPVVLGASFWLAPALVFQRFTMHSAIKLDVTELLNKRLKILYWSLRDVRCMLNVC